MYEHFWQVSVYLISKFDKIILRKFIYVVLFVGTQIEPRNIDYLHHLIVYVCPATFEELNGGCDSTEDIGDFNISWSTCISSILWCESCVWTCESCVWKFPPPGVDYEVFPCRYDSCGNYNGTYYPGGHTADYYYNCTMNEPYYDPIGPTDLALLIVVWVLVVAVLYLF